MGQSPTNSDRSRWNARRLLRLAVFPILIVGVAAFFQWRGNQSAHTDAPTSAIEAIVVGAANGAWGDTDPLVRSNLAPHLPTLPPKDGSIALRIELADASVRAATGATHLVTVLESGAPRLIVRCRYDPDPLRRAIVGYEVLQ
ncbi:MAG: hypothetical protein JNM94_03780 [Phycisphaerae bacterium]|nr:hypothetical protein [Phycisphaerae bacterium]